MDDIAGVAEKLRMTPDELIERRKQIAAARERLGSEVIFGMLIKHGKCVPVATKRTSGVRRNSQPVE